MKYLVKEVWTTREGKEWKQEYERSNNLDLIKEFMKFLQAEPWLDGFDVYEQKQFILSSKQTKKGENNA